MRELRRIENEGGRFTLVFLAAPGDDAAQIELTYNWDPEAYGIGRAFGHLAYEVDDVYALCAKLQAGGVTINRPPRDGRMAFVRSPDNISIELLQKGGALPPRGTLGLDAEHRQLVTRGTRPCGAGTVAGPRASASSSRRERGSRPGAGAASRRSARDIPPQVLDLVLLLVDDRLHAVPDRDHADEVRRSRRPAGGGCASPS